jgi:hypothetical protein
MTHKIAVCGTGKVSRAAVTALVEDLHNSLNEDTEFLVLLSDPQSDAAIHVGEWAADFELSYAAVSMLSKMDTRQTGVWESTDECWEISKASEICKLLSKDDYVVVAYDASDENTMRIISSALKRGVTTMDLTMGLSPIVLDDGDPEDEDEDDDYEIGREVQLITDNNPLLQIRKAISDVLEMIDSYQEKPSSSRVLAD